MKIKKSTIASLIIIMISILAFGAGFLQENVVSEATTLKIEVSEKEFDLERIDLRIRELVEDDRISARKATDEWHIAYKLAIELEITNDTLTVVERDLLMNLIARALENFNFFASLMNEAVLYNYWYIDDNTSDYIFNTEEKDGYDLNYSKEEYSTFNASKSFLYIVNEEEILNDFPFKDEIIAYGIIPTEFYSWRSYNFKEFLDQPLNTLQQEISDLKLVISELESKGSLFDYGVSLITVATILAAAMASQMNDKEREKEFSLIKSEIFNDKSMIITKKNRISMPFLFIALILAALGILI
ncbi:MAG: hypothetical protein ACFFDS_09675, partial [Candidatus Thorarchaeota archaeon]